MDKAKDDTFFTIADLVADQKFQRWVFEPDLEQDRYWREWIAANPGQEDTLNKARLLLQRLGFVEHFPTARQVEQALYAHPVMQPGADRPAIRRWLNNWVGRAAVLIGMLCLSYWGYRYYQSSARIVIRTEFGQVKTVYLPDSSIVTLNAHSELSYPKFWSRAAIREVWLSGEAFFEVRHLNRSPEAIKAKERFEVHAAGINIEVLGTSFDVKSVKDQTEVMLQTGRVQLKFKAGDRKSVLMEPGELVTYHLKGNVLTRKKVDASTWTAWTSQKMILNNATLETIAERLKDFYGLKIIWKDPALKTKSMEGTLMLNSLPNAVFVLSTSLNIQIEQKGDSLIFDQLNE